MFKRLCLIAVLGMASSLAMADATAVMDFPAVRDVGILGHSAENMSNAGGAATVRVAKGRQHFLLMDFDFEGIAQFVADNIEAGYTAKYELRLTTTDDTMDGLVVGIVASEMQAAGNDWVEGDGPFNYVNLNWTPGTYAATYIDPDLGTDLSTGPSQWMWGNQFDAHRNDAIVSNANDMVLGLAGANWVELTQDFMDLQLRDGTVGGEMQVRGFYTYDRNQEYRNGQVYTRESGDPNVEPIIRVSFDGGQNYLAGDADKDLDVDGTDLATIGINWSPGAVDKVWADGDFDANGNVDASDLAAVGLNWSPGGYTLPGVPEPATMSLLAIGAVALLRRRSR